MCLGQDRLTESIPLQPGNESRDFLLPLSEYSLSCYLNNSCWKIKTWFSKDINGKYTKQKQAGCKLLNSCSFFMPINVTLSTAYFSTVNIQFYMDSWGNSFWSYILNSIIRCEWKYSAVSIEVFFTITFPWLRLENMSICDKIIR